MHRSRERLHGMKGQFQGQDEVIIEAPHEQIWSILIDGHQLSDWMPIVKQTTSEIESISQIRTCDVEMGGKSGEVREQCTLFDDQREIGWEMLSDDFGFSRMFNNYGFSFELIPLGNNRTQVINRGFYDPRNPFVSVFNTVMIKRRSSKIRQSALRGIKALAEKHGSKQHKSNT